MMRFLVVLALMMLAVPAWSADIVVTRAIVVAPPNANAPTVAAYFTIENHGAVADQLKSVSTATAAEAMLHENINENGVMKMNMLDHLDIAAGAKIDMKPAGLHVMLMGAKLHYKIGDDVSFELDFAKAGKMQVVAKVVPLSQALNPQ
jgi:periplasmic copper chaperone A